MDRQMRQSRSAAGDFTTRADEETGKMYLSGYFIRFSSPTELWSGATEEVAPEALDDTLDGDIRCLVDHDTRLVLGRTTANTLTLKKDEAGLYADVEINPKDTEAVNAYERVKRGDVSQCSFGFDILDEEMVQDDESGNVHWIIKAIKLYEISIVTFPAYGDTEVTARKRQVEEINKRKREKWRADMRARVKGEKDGTESADDQEKN